MLDQRDRKLDLLALGLLAVTVFLAASLLSYDPADPPNHLVYPPHVEPVNICGPYGALAGTTLFGAFGVGAYYLVFSLAVLDWLLLVRRQIGEPLLRAVGWLLSLVGFSTLAAMAFPQLSPGPVIGSGGYLGAAGRGLLERNFASLGAYIVVVSLIVGGLLLSTDYVLIRMLAWTLRVPVGRVGRGLLRAGGASAGRAAGGHPIDRVQTAQDRMNPVTTSGDQQPGALSVRTDRPATRGVGEDPAKEDEQEGPPSDLHLRREPPVASPLRVRKPRKTQREEVMEAIEATAARGGSADYELPSLDLLLESEPFSFEEHEKEVRRKAEVLEKTFADFGFHVRVVEIQTGPVVAQFEVELEAGLRLSKITGLADDLAIALRVPSVRIVAPIPGKNTVGIEVPNAHRQLVRLREVMEESVGLVQAMRIPVYLGKDVAGGPIVVDLASLPHLLIAGRTGTGKSVCLNSIISSILMCRRPEEVRLLLIDPKLVELSPYKLIPHLMHPVVTDMRKAEAILAWAVEKMEERYHLLARAGVRQLSVYNQLGTEELLKRIQPVDDEERATIPTQMPSIVIVADEMADLMMTAAKEIEGHIIRLAQKSRAVGIHLVMATQKPTVDVITGLIKSNLPARICFEVSSRTDSRVVLDEMGADRLLGDGDMLFLRPGTSTLIRGQGTYLSDDEIARVIDAVATSEPQYVTELVQLKASESGPQSDVLAGRDELYEAAVDVVVRQGRGSLSLLQRALGIGYGRAARLIDYMAEDGIVGPYNGSQAREILIGLEEWEQMRGQSTRLDPIPSPPRPSNRIRLSPSSWREDGVAGPHQTESVAAAAARRRNPSGDGGFVEARGDRRGFLPGGGDGDDQDRCLGNEHEEDYDFDDGEEEEPDDDEGYEDCEDYEDYEDYEEEDADEDEPDDECDEYEDAECPVADGQEEAGEDDWAVESA